MLDIFIIMHDVLRQATLTLTATSAGESETDFSSMKTSSFRAGRTAGGKVRLFQRTNLRRNGHFPGDFERTFNGILIRGLITWEKKGEGADA